MRAMIVVGTALFAGVVLIGLYQRAHPPTAEDVARSEEDDLRGASRQVLRDTIIKTTRAPLPDSYADAPTILRRDGKRVLAVVDVGVKDGSLSEPVVTDTFLVAFEWNTPSQGRISWNKETAALKCANETPTAGEIQRALEANGWPTGGDRK